MNDNKFQYNKLLDELLDKRVGRVLTEQEEEYLLDQLTAIWWELDESEKSQIKERLKNDSRRIKLLRRQSAEKRKILRAIADSVKEFSINKHIPEGILPEDDTWKEKFAVYADKLIDKLNKTPLFLNGKFESNATMIGKAANGPGILLKVLNSDSLKELGSKKSVKSVLFEATPLTRKSDIDKWINFSASLHEQIFSEELTNGYMSASFSALLAFYMAAKDFEISQVQDIDFVQFVSVTNTIYDFHQSLLNDHINKFSVSPERVYISVIRINDIAYIYVITSSGEIIHKHNIGVSYGDFYQFNSGAIKPGEGNREANKFGVNLKIKYITPGYGEIEGINAFKKKLSQKYGSSLVRSIPAAAGGARFNELMIEANVTDIKFQEIIALGNDHVIHEVLQERFEPLFSETLALFKESSLLELPDNYFKPIHRLKIEFEDTTIFFYFQERHSHLNSLIWLFKEYKNNLDKINKALISPTPNFIVAPVFLSRYSQKKPSIETKFVSPELVEAKKPEQLYRYFLLFQLVSEYFIVDTQKKTFRRERADVNEILHEFYT